MDFYDPNIPRPNSNPQNNIAKKIEKSSHKPKIKIDEYKRVLKFLMEWERFSYKYK